MNNRTNTKNPQTKLASYTNSNWKQVNFKATSNGYNEEYTNRQSNQQNYMNNDKYCHELDQFKKNRNYTNFQDRKVSNHLNRIQNFNMNISNYDSKKKKSNLKENIQNYQDETNHYQQFYNNNDDYRRCITQSNQNLAYVKNANQQFTRNQVYDHFQMMANVYESKDLILYFRF
jgi:hypothetical protein